MAAGTDDPWEDFFDEDEEKRRIEVEKKQAAVRKETIVIRKADDSKAEEDRPVVDKTVEPKTEAAHTESEANTRLSNGNDNSVDHKAENSDDRDTSSEKKSRKKKKGKKSKSPTRPKSATRSKSSQSRPSTAHTYSDHPKSQSSYIRERSSADNRSRLKNQENKKESERKLHRPRQQNKFHSVDLQQAVEQSSRECLEQKFEELEDLIARPLADTRSRFTQQQVHKMVNLQHCHGESGHTGDVQDEDNAEGQAYSTIRILQSTGPSVHLQIYNHKRASPRSKDSPKANVSPRHTVSPRRRGSVDSPNSSSSGRSDSRNEDRNWVKQNVCDHYSSDEFESDDNSPSRPYKSTDMHLKHSDNPKLLEWLRRKDIEHRRARRAERKKKREERNDKMVESELKIARREKSSERVKKWMETKQKEAILRRKAERKLKKQEAEELKAKQARSQENGVQGTRIDRPQTAPREKSPYRLIKRPNSAARLDDGQGSAAKPPDSKFLHKQSVTGRVRLMKFQNDRNAMVRSADQQRYAELSTEEREKKVKTSYDEWLIAKKKQDVEKRKAAKQQKELMKSDPEMERIIPELARRRIERIKNGKKSIDTGLNRNSSTSREALVEGEGQQNSVQGQCENGEPKSPSYKLAVNGAAATIEESPARARPSSAKVRPPPPRKAASPKRPQSAQPASKTKSKEDQRTEPSPYRLPFPDNLGVPYHVKRVQEKIFSEELNAQSNDVERPEPQGCASAESAGCPQGVDKAQTSVTSPPTTGLLKEIEAEATQSDMAKDCALKAVQNAINMAATKNSVTSDTSVKEESNEQAVEASEALVDVAETLDKAAGVPQALGKEEEEEEEEADEEKLEGRDGHLEEEVTQEEKEDSAENADACAGDAEQSEDSVKGDDQECQNETEKAEEERDEKDNEEAMQKDQEEEAMAAEEEEVVEKPDCSDEQGSEETPENKVNVEQEESTPPSQSVKIENDETKHEGDNNDWDLDEDLDPDFVPERTVKHVSFSEELTSVFEPSSTEACANSEEDFDEDITGYEEQDDRGDDWTSLDDVPDPI